MIPPFPATTAPPWLLAALERGLAGVTLFAGNIAGAEQLAALTQRLRGATDDPIIAIDEEGGDVTRIAHLTGSRYPGNAALGAVDDTGLTAGVYGAIGADLAAAGITMDLAPSVDTNTASDNPVIGTRAFGSDPALVSRHAAAAVTGLQRAGVAACAKHFPGHGGTADDTHQVAAVVPGDLAELWQRDLPPFRAAISAGVRAVMTGHLVVPDLTHDQPVTFSRAALTGLLRHQLGFRGVIVTDALEMRAVADPHGIPRAAVLATAAGADLLCLGRDQDEQMYLAVRAALAAAVAAGALAAERIQQAAERVRELRRWLATRAGHDAGTGGDAAERAALGLRAARRAARLSGTVQPIKHPLVVQVEPPANIAVGTVPWGLRPWLAASDLVQLAGPAAAADTAAVLRRAAGRSLIVVTRSPHRDPAARELVSGLVAARPDATVVEMGLPIWRPAASAYLMTFGAGYANCQAAAEILGLTGAAGTAA
jgi:beta-N-acetylhexosaminidase